MNLFNNKTLYGALTRWGYTNTHITVDLGLLFLLLPSEAMAATYS
jgi:hypothetical protein